MILLHFSRILAADTGYGMPPMFVHLDTRHYCTANLCLCYSRNQRACGGIRYSREDHTFGHVTKYPIQLIVNSLRPQFSTKIRLFTPRRSPAMCDVLIWGKHVPMKHRYLNLGNTEYHLRTRLRRYFGRHEPLFPPILNASL